MAPVSDFSDPEFAAHPALAAEAERVYDICAGCRRCYHLCPSFGYLLDTIDTHEGEARALTEAEQRRVVELCYGCQLCYPHCPYTPPHRWEVDFPRLMLRAKLARSQQEGLRLRDRLLANPELLGRVASRVPRLANWANRNRLGRWVLERTLGIDRRRRLPEYTPRFSRWLRAQRPPADLGSGGRVALFYTTSVEFNGLGVGQAAVRILWRSRVDVSCPAQVCCGMPALDSGDLKGALARARANVRSLAAEVEQGREIVVPGPTCSRMIKQEYPRMVPGEASRRVAEHTFDLCEYLMRLANDGKLDRNFRRPLGTVAYHAPCHLRVQEIGFKTKELLELVPGTRVVTVERCSGMDGTWGLKREYYELSKGVAAPLLRELEAADAALVVSDCQLAGLQIAELTGARVYHPLEALDLAYGDASPCSR